MRQEELNRKVQGHYGYYGVTTGVPRTHPTAQKTTEHATMRWGRSKR